MWKLAAITALATATLCGMANAQDAAPAPAAPPTAAAPTGDLQSALVAYAGYHTDVSELRSKRIENADALETALDTVARHNRDSLTRGWVAYGANTAAQSNAYVTGVRDAARYYGRDATIRAILADPYYAYGLRGANDATRLVLDSANADAQRIIGVADRYQEMAYGLQRLRWANAVAPQQMARVTRVRALGAPGAYTFSLGAEVTPRLTVTPASLSPGSDPTAFGGRRFWDAVSGGGGLVEVASTAAPGALKLNDTRGEALYRMTAIAALQALDATSENSSQISQLMNDPRSRDCLEMAQLQLYQCMSAARFRYENAFCLGQHGLRDVGLCFGNLAQPDTAAMAPLTATPDRPLAN